MAPEALLDAVTPVSTGSAEVLQVTMTGPSDAEAMRRLAAFTEVYLQFRAEQVTAQSGILIDGYRKQIVELQRDLDATDRRIQDLAANGDSATDSMSDAITTRSRVNGQIGDLEQKEQDAELQKDSIVNASKAIDPPAPVAAGHLKHLVLVLVSGLIGGLAVGLFLVILQAILSDRLWLRVEVASALDTPVPLSVGGSPRPAVLRALAFLPWVSADGCATRRIGAHRECHRRDGHWEGRRPPSVGVVCSATPTRSVSASWSLRGLPGTSRPDAAPSSSTSTTSVSVEPALASPRRAYRRGSSRGVPPERRPVAHPRAGGPEASRLG